MSSVINLSLGRSAGAAFAVALAVSACSSSSGDGSTAMTDAASESAALGAGGSGGTGGSGATGSGGFGTGGALGSGGSGPVVGGAAGASVLDGSVTTDGVAGSDGNSVSDASGASDAPPNCLSGNPTQPMELRLGYRTDTGFTPLGAAPAPIGLAQAPQGGQVLFVGVEVRNVASCTATIATALVDTQTQAVVSLESRPIFLDLAPDGWLAPLQPTALSNYSNLPACPRAGLTRSVDANQYQLRVNLTDAGGRMVQASMDVVPTCPTGVANALCHCQCAQGYLLGMVCN